MDPLYIASTEPQSGKTVLAAALGLLARQHGLRVTYRKVGGDSGPPAQRDPDVQFMAALFASDGMTAGAGPGERSGEAPLALSVERTAPLEEVRSPGGNAQLALLEGGSDPALDARLSESLGARVLFLCWYQEGAIGRDIRAVADPFHGRLAGLLLNGVPATRLHDVEAHLLSALRAAGLAVLGALPQSRVLRAPTLGELVAFLGAQVIAFPEGLDQLVERVMVGALALDGGIYYYGQTDRKVVITRWDRPDLQMPALATGCQGLILTGGQGPIPYVWNRVQELRVPVAVVQGGTMATASRLNEGFLAQRGRPHLQKAREMAFLLAQVPGLLSSLLPVGPAAR